MTTALRFTATVACLWLGTTPAFAQLPVAPEPHPTLDELVKEYQRCGLPVPPKDAELVHLSTILGFRYPSTEWGERTRCLVGGSWRMIAPKEGFWGDGLLPDTGLPVKPVPESLNGITGSAEYWFFLAVQVNLRGWDDLARAAYAAGRRELAEENAKHPEQGSITENLRWTAWRHWITQLTVRHSDRKEAWARLSYLETQGTKSPDRWEEGLVDDLKLTILPRKSKPGTAEALIDELTEYWDDTDDWYNEAGHSDYWKLVELGFDAVPALMEHLKDARLTRAQLWDWKVAGLSRGMLRVGTVTERILDGLSGGKYQTEAWYTPAADWVPAKDHKWWKKAKQLGEERWLLDIVLPAATENSEPYTPNEIALRVIRVKYPNRLGEVYRTLLTKRPKFNSDSVTREIVASKLPFKTKLSFLKEGVATKEGWHRHHAEGVIAILTGATVAKRVLPSLGRLPGMPR
jgi:hypothetical protein